MSFPHPASVPSGTDGSSVPLNFAALPPEILGLILGHVDRSTKASVARVCKSLTKTATSSLWSVIYIDGADVGWHGVTICNHLTRRALSLLRIFYTRPEVVGRVGRLVMLVCNRTAEVFAEVVAVLKPTLQSLDIMTDFSKSAMMDEIEPPRSHLGRDGRTSNASDRNATWRTLDDADSEQYRICRGVNYKESTLHLFLWSVARDRQAFHRLERLSVEGGRIDDIAACLRLTPRLQRLAVAVYERPKDLRVIPAINLPRLRYLHIETDYWPEIATLGAPIIQDAIELCSMSLYSRDCRLHGFDFSHPLVRALAARDKLQAISIGLPYQEFAALCSASSVDCVNVIRILDEFQPWQSHMRTFQLDDVLATPSLRRCNITGYEDVEDRDEPDTSYDLEAAQRHFVRFASERLGTAPMLDMVVYAPGYLITEAPSDAARAAIFDWRSWMCEQNTPVEGLVIRSYADKGDTLHHARIFISEICKHDERLGQITDPAQHGWRSMAAYKDASVPPELLADVYAVDGLPMVWYDGDRHMSLSPVAWAVLRAWYEEQTTEV